MKNLWKRILGVFLAAALVVSFSGPVLGAETASDTATASTDSTSSSSSDQTIVVQNTGGGFGFVPFSPLPFLPPLPFPAWFPPTQSITIINNTSDSGANQAVNLKILELLDKILKKLEEGKEPGTASDTADTGKYPDWFDPKNPPVAPTEPPKLPENADPNDPEVIRIKKLWDDYLKAKADFDTKLTEWKSLKETWDTEQNADTTTASGTEETASGSEDIEDADSVLNE